MIVALEPVVPAVAVGDPLRPPLLLPPMPLVLLVVPALQAFEELVELGVLALLDADPGCPLLLPVPLLAVHPLAPLPILVPPPPPPPPIPLLLLGGADDAETLLADEGTPVVVASGRQVSTCTGNRGDTLNEHRT